jgi:hypothetical protein
MVVLLATSVACGGERSRRVEHAAGDSATLRLPLDTARDTGRSLPNEGARGAAGESGDSAMGAPGAVAVLTSYFGAINAHHFHDAYHLWFDEGAASGLTLEEFARGYDRTRSTTFRAGAPSRIEGAAGSRYVTIPVTIDATTTDGLHQHFEGSIVLRRVVVPGAENEGRSWHIYSAAIHEVR